MSRSGQNARLEERRRMERQRLLVLEREAKIAPLLSGAVDRRLEASGVLAGDGCFYVIFDNAPDIGRLGTGLRLEPGANFLIPQVRGDRAGFEDIAHDVPAGRYFVLIEASQRAAGFMAKVQEYDSGFVYRESAWLDFPLDGPNKGLEGLTCVHRAGRTFLLGLCEGNRCKDGREGRRPGGGRIQVFERGSRQWDRVSQAAYLESDTPGGQPFTGRQFSNDEVYRSGREQQELRRGDTKVEGIIHYVRMRHDRARAQLAELRRDHPPGASGATFSGKLEPLPSP
jgi:hypothetical protein